eukprot:13518049-Heterocapsa_arctica.AAC.1
MVLWTLGRPAFLQNGVDLLQDDFVDPRGQGGFVPEGVPFVPAHVRVTTVQQPGHYLPLLVVR